MSRGGRGPGSRQMRLFGAWALAGWFAIISAAPARAADPISLAARIDGRSVSEASENRPIRLRPNRPARISVRITNRSSERVEVRKVRLSGRVMGLTFFAYETSVVLSVAPGATDDRQYSLELGDLDGQATGLVVGAVSALDARGNTLSELGTVVDVRGSVRSVYGLFGIGVATLTVLAFAVALVALARHRLAENRWRRALRFLTPGIGLGLSIVFTLSAFRVFVPRPGRWVPIVLVSAAALFALGYLTPSPEADEWDDEPRQPVAVGR